MESSDQDNNSHKSPSLYEILEISSDASIDEIKTAYRKLALKHHPDKGGNEQTFKKLSEAYQILSNNDLREKYDQSQVIPETILIPPLKVFADCFNQWLSQYPLIEFIFKDSCHDVIDLLNKHSDNPVVKLLINSLTGSNNQQPTTDDLLRATNFFTAEWFRKIYPNQQNFNNEEFILNKKVYVTLEDIYIGKRYPHQFSITNEDLKLSNDYKIINPDVQINIPLHHSAIDIETDLHIINQRHATSYIQKVTVQLDVITINGSNFYRIGDYDLLVYVNITLEQFINQNILCIPYFNRKMLRFNNPFNCNLRQLYKIDNIALPNRQEKKRGDLYLFFNLIIHKEQQNMVIPDLSQGFIYPLHPVDTKIILKSEEMTASPENDAFTVFSPSGLILSAKFHN